MFGRKKKAALTAQTLPQAVKIENSEQIERSEPAPRETEKKAGTKGTSVPKPEIHPLEYINEFSLKKKIFDSEVEAMIYSVLKTFINENYIILPHVGLREVFFWKYERYWDLTHKAALMHFDFGIYNSDFQPVLFIEINGKDHEKKSRKENDLFKKELLEKHRLKLVTIDATTSMVNKEVREEVIKSIREEIPNRKSYPAYCPECGAVLEIKSNKKCETLFYGCSRFRYGCKGSKNINNVPPLYEGIPAE